MWGHYHVGLDAWVHAFFGANHGRIFPVRSGHSDRRMFSGGSRLGEYKSVGAPLHPAIDRRNFLPVVHIFDMEAWKMIHVGGCFKLDCECVFWTREAREEAVDRLVRPHEVAHIVETLRARMRLTGKFNPVSLTSGYMHRKFASEAFRRVPDPDACDRWCSPAATLRTGEGDCDDWGLVVVSLLLGLGVRSHVVIGAFDGTPHLWVEGKTREGRGFLLEATNGDLTWGVERPNSYKKEYAIVPRAARQAA
jgi:hypothetical protein